MIKTLAKSAVITLTLLSTTAFAENGALKQLLKDKDTTAFYQMQGNETVWFNAEGKTKNSIKPFIKAMQQADAHALNSADYDLKKAVATANSLEGKDIAVTKEILKFIRDMQVGKVTPNKVYPDLFLLPEDRNFAAVLTNALKKPDYKTDNYLTDIAPNHPQYRKLQDSLLKYRKIAKEGSWQQIESSGVIKPGNEDSRMPAIRERLRQNGWMKPNDTIDNIYDKQTEAAVRHFQKHRGAKVDGIIGSETFKVLNVSVEDRIKQIELSMERWRWLPENLGEKYVLVNIAGFYAEGRKNGSLIVQTPVIVGKVAHQTPVFSSMMRNVKFYPDWTVPSSIAKRYLLDKIQNNPNVINTLGYEIFKDWHKLKWSSVDVASLTKSDFPPYSFRQKPGAKNALGLVRFTIDNNEAIYLHDTPDEQLFEEDQRALSSGCIRVGKPVQLAQFVLANNDNISSAEVAEKFNRARRGEAVSTEIIKLKQPIPVHLVYMTAWVDEDGDTRFEQDIYNRDRKLERALGL